MLKIVASKSAETKHVLNKYASLRLVYLCLAFRKRRRFAEIEWAGEAVKQTINEIKQ